MLPEKEPVGVIIGRFQVPRLHDGHKTLIKKVLESHSRVIIFLGLSPIKCTINNPLDFESRKKILLDEFPNLTVLYIKDMKCDKKWSEHLDEMISDIIGPNQKAILYGGRDSFINHYYGKFPTKELKQDKFVRGVDVRVKVSSEIKDSYDFRCGVIWATQNQYPAAIPTVDIAIFNEDYSEILLGRKKDENEYRFIGGFVRPGDTYEDTAYREVLEETGLEISELQMIRSFVIDDWRFKKEINKITTVLFTSVISKGRPAPNDDIYELKWFDFKNINIDSDIIYEHREMMKYLRQLPTIVPNQIVYSCKRCRKKLGISEITWWCGDIYCANCHKLVSIE